jgi:hypothetical protein
MYTSSSSQPTHPFSQRTNDGDAQLAGGVEKRTVEPRLRFYGPGCPLHGIENVGQNRTFPGLEPPLEIESFKRNASFLPGLVWDSRPSAAQAIPRRSSVSHVPDGTHDLKGGSKETGRSQ